MKFALLTKLQENKKKSIQMGLIIVLSLSIFETSSYLDKKNFERNTIVNDVYIKKNLPNIGTSPIVEKNNFEYINNLDIDAEKPIVLVLDTKFNGHQMLVNKTISHVLENIDENGYTILNFNILELMHKKDFTDINTINDIPDYFAYKKIKDETKIYDPNLYNKYLNDNNGAYLNLIQNIASKYRYTNIKINMSFGSNGDLSSSFENTLKQFPYENYDYIKRSYYINNNNLSNFNIELIDYAINNAKTHILKLIDLARANKNIEYYISAGNNNSDMRNILYDLSIDKSLSAMQSISNDLMLLIYVKKDFNENDIRSTLKNNHYFNKNIDLNNDKITYIVNNILKDFDTNLEKYIFMEEIKKNPDIIKQFNIIESISIQTFNKNMIDFSKNHKFLDNEILEFYDKVKTGNNYINKNAIDDLYNLTQKYSNEYPDIFFTTYDSVLLSSKNQEFNRIGVHDFIGDSLSDKLNGTSTGTPYVLAQDLKNDIIENENKPGIIHAR